MNLLEDLAPEIFQAIIGKLDYADAFALRQTSHSLYRAVNIPTIHSYRRNVQIAGKTRARSLEILSKENLIPEGRAVCLFCRHLGTPYEFTKVHGDLIRSTAKTTADFKALADVFCLDCGARRGLYKPGELIEEFDVHRSMTKTPCYCCKTMETLEYACQYCRACQYCCRISNVLLNDGSFPRSQLRDGQACPHRQVIRHFGGARRRAWYEAVFYNRRSLWTLLWPDLQARVLKLLDRDSIYAFRLTCHEVNTDISHILHWRKR